MTAQSGWENFYVIVGSSAGALIGLQFVVITLIADIPIEHGAAQAVDAFATPTIVHVGAALLLAAVLSAPWHGIAPVAVLWGPLGLSGVVYAAIVAPRLQRQTVVFSKVHHQVSLAVRPNSLQRGRKLGLVIMERLNQWSQGGRMWFRAERPHVGSLARIALGSAWHKRK